MLLRNFICFDLNNSKRLKDLLLVGNLFPISIIGLLFSKKAWDMLFFVIFTSELQVEMRYCNFAMIPCLPMKIHFNNIQDNQVVTIYSFQLPYSLSMHRIQHILLQKNFLKSPLTCKTFQCF